MAVSKAKKDKKPERLIASNRKAFHDYEVLERLEAGLELVGTEVKALREGKGNLADAHVTFHHNEAYLLAGHISPYSHGNRENHAPDRTRRLLLHRQEINRIMGKVKEKGLTVIPLDLHWSKNRVKVELGLCRGKKLHDKRQADKDRDWAREKGRILKSGARGG
ncbi:MAG: SsrA-binding protein [Alphaproteobacteria bacterium CG_4_10_14_0_2_um_filter_63_37]|nr:MAG: SsrA-binding protein [Proteobacteria bacterium CG1_02_64_396]PJA25810.1 MAG: SsrA-binding protein [Alphaproteobacteria bacterium CG_4_10_14_0_2_um_filter_63_37]